MWPLEAYWKELSNKRSNKESIAFDPGGFLRFPASNV